MDIPRVIIFDLDGVIFDSVELMHSFTRDSHPGVTDEEILNLHRGNIFASLANTALLKKEETDDERHARGEAYSLKKFEVPMYPGVKELLEELSATCELAINTSAREENCIPLLEKHGIKSFFSFIATRTVHESKVEKFKIICEHYNIAPERVIFVTDTVGDVGEAFVSGIKTIVVTWGIHTRADFDVEEYPNIVGFADNVDALRLMLGDC